MLICYIFLGVLSFVLLIYFILEVHYFLRVLLVVILARISRKKTHILSETTLRGICLTSDIDSMLTHMNNSRFLRELDFAKIDFYERTGLYRCVRKSGGNLFVGATTIRYRRFIKLFSKYLITTKVIYWDEQSIYMEHRFITPSDNFINAIILCRTRLVDCNAEQIVNDVISRFSNDRGGGDTAVESGKVEKPQMPPELAKWIEYNEISSELLRKP